MKQLVKRVLYAIAPDWTAAMMAARARVHSHNVVAALGGRELARKLIERFGSRVQSGRFAGLMLTPEAHAEQIGPYLLGTYEDELDEAWNIVFRGSYSQVIDIGAKFGYYAVGLGKRFPSASVIAFDTDWWARKAVLAMAAANEVANVQILSRCTPQWLENHTAEAAFIISDCEGCEATLFTEEVVANLRSATLIIETHDCFVPGVSDRLRGLFGKTHSVRVYEHDESVRKSEFPLDFLSTAERTLATTELRPPQIWILCLPTSGPNKDLSLIAP